MFTSIYLLNLTKVKRQQAIFAKGSPDTTQLQHEPEAEGEDGEEAPPSGTVKQPPEWMGTFDTNAMASMMQDQNMQQLLAQLVQSMPGPTTKPHPDDPFLDSGFIGQMFHAQTINSMTLLQQAVEKLSMTPEPEKAKEKEPHKYQKEKKKF